MIKSREGRLLRINGGIGIKTAAQLIKEYGDLETLLSRAGEIKQPKRREVVMANADKARISRKLVALEDHVPLQHELGELVLRDPDLRVLLPFLEDLEFTNLVTRLRARYGTDGGVAARADATPPTPAARRPDSALSEPPPTPLAGPAVRPSIPSRYATLTSLEGLAALCDEARMSGFLGVHLESEPPDDPHGDIVGVALSAKPGIAWYAPLAAATSQANLAIEGPEEEQRFELSAALEVLKPILEDPSVLKVLHDAKGPMKLLARKRIDMTPIDDTLLLSFVLGGGRDDHGLGDICDRELGRRPTERKEVVGSGKTQVTFPEVALDRATAYAASLADSVLQARNCLRRKITAEHLVSVYETIERPLVPVLLAMENAGVRVDPEALKALSEDFGARMAQHESDVYRLAGRKGELAQSTEVQA